VAVALNVKKHNPNPSSKKSAGTTSVNKKQVGGHNYKVKSGPIPLQVQRERAKKEKAMLELAAKKKAVEEENQEPNPDGVTIVVGVDRYVNPIPEPVKTPPHGSAPVISDVRKEREALIAKAQERIENSKKEAQAVAEVQKTYIKGGKEVQNYTETNTTTIENEKPVTQETHETYIKGGKEVPIPSNVVDWNKIGNGMVTPSERTREQEKQKEAILVELETSECVQQKQSVKESELMGTVGSIEKAIENENVEPVTPVLSDVETTQEDVKELEFTSEQTTETEADSEQDNVIVTQLREQISDSGLLQSVEHQRIVQDIFKNLSSARMQPVKDVYQRTGIAETERMEAIDVTPEIAAKWLEKHNTLNRPLNRRHVAEIVESMKSGAFVPSGETIKFCEDDSLLDGQHRLWAICVSGLTYTFKVEFGLPPEARQFVDINKTRSKSDIVAISNPGLSFTARDREVINICFDGSRYFTVQDIMTIAHLYHKELKFVESAFSGTFRKTASVSKGAPVRGAMFLTIERAGIQEGQEEKLKRFVQILKTGISSSEVEGTVAVLFRWLQDNVGKTDDRRIDMLLKTQYMLDHYLKGRPRVNCSSGRELLYPLIKLSEWQGI
jgi:hypothetical protein